MSKLKETLLMMAVEKETFEVNGKTFQIIEVVEAEQPQPDYSHLVGKWLKYIGQEDRCFTKNKWYFTRKVAGDGELLFTDNEGHENGFLKRETQKRFDLTNPSETNPDEVKKILVPKEIGIRNDTGLLGIGFGTNQCLLSRTTDELPYRVVSKTYTTPIQCELIKCERAELKKGDLAYRMGDDETSFATLEGYSVIINEEKYCFIDEDQDVICGNKNWTHWYKLQPIEQ